LVYAANAGIYKKYGLNVQLVPLVGGAVIVAALASGSLDLGESSSLAVITAIAKGLPFTVVGNLASYNADKPDLGMIVTADSPIKTPKDLADKTIAVVSLTDMNSVAMFAWLDKNGVDRSTLKYVEVPPAASLAALEQGRVSAVTLFEPYLSTFLAGGKTRILAYPYEAIGRHFSTALLFGSPKWVADHQDAVNKFLRATQEASTYISAHEGDSARIIGEFTGVDPASLANIRHGERGVVMKPADLQPVIDAAAKYKVIPNIVPAQQMICLCALSK
jgi:NitT/TauT family transport system substrate-binding protein